MKKILLLIIATLSISLTGVQAQSMFTLNYDMNLPVGSVTDFISSYQFRGISGQYRYMATDNLSVGFDLGYNGWYQKREDITYQIDDENVITGTFYNYNRMWTMHAAGDYYFGDPSKKVRPYAGIGLGVNSIDLESYIVDYVITVSNKWPFSVSPEIGLQYTAPGSHVSFNASAYYNYTTYDYSELINDLSYAGFRVGVTWR